jgi:hypothetical protein
MRQVALGDHAEEAAAVYYDRGVEQRMLEPQRCAHDHDRSERGAAGHDLLERLECRSQQCVLMEKIIDAVSRDPELGEHHQRGMGVRRALGEGDHALDVEPRLGDADMRNCGRDARKTGQRAKCRCHCAQGAVGSFLTKNVRPSAIVGWT